MISLWQVAWGRIGRRRKAVVHDGGPCGTKETIDVKKGEVVELVAHLAWGACSAAFVEEVLGEAVALTQPQRKKVTNVAVPEDGDEYLPQGDHACLMNRRLRYAAVPLQVVRQNTSRAARFLERFGNGAVRECAQGAEGDGPGHVTEE